MNNTNVIKEFYEKYNEDDRFTKDKAHSVEYLTTKHYIEKNLKKGDRILEIGAGTGAYSINYAKEGYKVDAIELSTRNLSILKSKITDDMDINAIEGNALDLSMYEDNTFDVTLLLGPLYHLFTEEEKEKAIREAVRVTKKDGFIYIAYITSDSIVVSNFLKKHRLLELKKLSDENYKLIDKVEEIFNNFYVEEFNNLMNKYNIEHITSFATEGLSYIMKEYVNDLSEEEFNIWVDYHLKNCERKELLSYSTHVIYIGKKK